MHKPIFIIRHLFICFILIELTSGCVDTHTDYSNIDKNIKVMVNDLKFNFGTTEKIMLRDLIKVDGSLQSDANHLYNIVNTGERNFSFQIEPFVVQKINQHIIIPTNLWQIYLNSMTMQRTRAFATTTDFVPFTAESNIKLFINWKEGIKAIERIELQNTNIELNYSLTGTDAQNFVIVGMKDMQITLPSFFKSGQLGAGNILKVPDANWEQGVRTVPLGKMTMDAVEFDKALTNGSQPEGTFAIQGKVKIAMLQNNVLPSTSPDLKSEVEMMVNGNSGSNPVVTSARGVFSHSVNCMPFNFDIKKELPDCLNPDSMHLTPTNVTMRLNVDMTQVPVGIVMQNASISAENKSVNLLQEPVTWDKGKENIVYLYQGDTPYDTTPIAATAIRSKMNSFDQLLEHVPDSLTVNFAENDVSLKEETTTVDFGKNYEAKIDYTFFLPFSFHEGFQLYYHNLSSPIDWNMKDWQADKVVMEINATAESTIPLGINLKFEALDKDGNVLPVTLDVSHIKAAENEMPTETAISVKSNPVSNDVLRNIARIGYIVKAAAESNNSNLRSNQYLQIKDAKVQISGEAIIDLNNNK